MSESDLYQAKMYLLRPEKSIWSWAKRGDAVQWNSGQTIAFVNELKEILQHQTENGTRGLPPFGSLLLLIAATRQNWNAKANREWRMAQFEFIVKLKSQKLLQDVLKGLDLVNELANENKVSIKAKQTLADLVFKKTMRTSVEVANEVVRILDCSVEEIFEGTDQLARPKVSESLLRDLRTLERGLKGLDDEVLALRRETGVDKVPAADKALEIPNCRAPGELFSELESDRELYVLGRAARQLYSVMSLPQPSFRESELQQGGVSDIANRGPLDRLLLSELAHDDLTLAVRVAVNEAMYLRRESPPHTTQPGQLIVLDSGLVSWGMPRLLGTAMGLALVARSDDDQEHEVYSAQNDQLMPISLSNREGIVSHLKVLRPELDLSESLTAIEETLNDSESDCDVVLITNARTVNSERFSTRLNQANLFGHPRLARLFLGSLERSGETKLIEVNSVGRKVIKQLKFDLDLLTQDAPKTTTHIDRSGNFPALIGLERMPLLLSYGKVLSKFVWPIGPDRLILLTGDGRFLYFTDRNTGGEQLSDRIPTAQVWWFSKRPIDGVWSAVIGNPARKDYRLINFDEDSNTISEVPLIIDANPIGFCSHQGSLFVIFPDGVAILDRVSGQATKTLPTKERKWISDRFFRLSNGREFFALASDGTRPVLESLPLPWTVFDLSICPPHIYETQAIEGPIAVRPMPQGEVHFVATGETVHLKIPEKIKKVRSLSVENINPFNNELTISPQNEFRSYRFNVSTGASLGESYGKAAFPQTLANQLILPSQLRHRFRSVAVAADGTFRLASKNQPRLKFQLQNGSMVLENTADDTSRKLQRHFQSINGPAGTRYDLKVARWKDGSEAWLDSRGMLHLRSADRSVAELTITLSHGPCAGWCSDGTVFGPKFHVGDGLQKPLDEVFLLLECFCGQIVNS